MRLVTMIALPSKGCVLSTSFTASTGKLHAHAVRIHMFVRCFPGFVMIETPDATILCYFLVTSCPLLLLVNGEPQFTLFVHWCTIH